MKYNYDLSERFCSRFGCFRKHLLKLAKLRRTYNALDKKREKLAVSLREEKDHDKIRGTVWHLAILCMKLGHLAEDLRNSPYEVKE